MIDFAALAFFNAVHRGRWFIGDLDGSYRRCQSVAVGVRKQQDRLFRVIDDAVGEAGLVIHDERDDIAAGNIFGGDDSELVPAECLH